MDTHPLLSNLKNEPNPVILEFWAPWCAPCRMMAPALDQLTQEYQGRVTVKKINADQNAELVRSLKVMAIPTMIVYQQGQEIQRRVGAQSPQALNALFARLADGSYAQTGLPSAGLDPLTRLLRLGSGGALAVLGMSADLWPVILLGGLVAFWGWYDRCPIWQAVSAKIKALRR